MQFGAIDVFQNKVKERHFKQERLMGVAVSTVYILLIVLLVQLKTVDSSAFIPNQQVLNLDTLLPSAHSIK